MWKLLALFGISCMLFLAAFLVDFGDNEEIDSRKVYAIEKQLNTLVQETDQLVARIPTSNQSPFDFDAWWDPQLQVKGVSAFVFRDSVLVYWSANLPVSKTRLLAIAQVDRYQFLNLGNAWYMCHSYQHKFYKVLCLTRIQSDYYYQNALLTNSFNPYLDFPSHTLIAPLGTDIGLTVTVSSDQQALFVVSTDVGNDIYSTSSLVLCWLALWVLLWLVTLLFYDPELYKDNYWFLLGAALVLVCFRLLLYSKAQAIQEPLRLFSPKIYAESGLLSSLGDLILHFVFLLHFLIIVFRSKVHWSKLLANKHKRYLLALFFTVLTSFFAVVVHYLIRSLVINSDIALEIYLFKQLNIYTAFAYLAIVMMLSLLMGLLWIQNYFTDKAYRLLLPQCISLLVFYLWIIGFDYTVLSVLLFVFLSIVVIICQQIWYPKGLTIQTYIFAIFVLTIYLSVMLVICVQAKENREQEALAEKLFTERDPIAEMLLRDIEIRIKQNNYWQERLTAQIQPDELFKRLHDEYFRAYFQRYDIQFQLCKTKESVIYLENVEKNCMDFFQTEVENYGIPLQNSANFWFMNNFSGRIFYQGAFTFANDEMLFIELYSKLDVETIGYPELLLDKTTEEQKDLTKYSYAKYQHNELILHKGAFDYNFELTDDQYNQNEYTQRHYRHKVFKNENAYTIIISKPSKDLLDWASLFSYTFVLLLVSMWVIFMTIDPFKLQIDRLSYQLRISTVMLGGIFISLTAVTLATLFFTIKQSADRNISSIHEKMQSLIVELDKELLNDDPKDIYLHPDLYATLLALSNSYNTDLNLYDLSGNLVASSRPEIFDHLLQGEQINRQAFQEIVLNKSSKYIHQEQIGDLKFNSAYSIYYNRHGKPIVIINLPYFVRNSYFEDELQQLVGTIINIYIFLILGGIILAALVANQITRPLDEVRQKMTKLNLTTQAEPIDYKGNNELGDLVRAYNRMIAELAMSAQQMADQERELAWREMAKQIAHEIKNPLTPMKLGLQHALMMKQQGREGWENKIEQMAHTVLQQIEVLAQTANEFSDFARVKNALLEPIDLDQLIKNAVALFDNMGVKIFIQSTPHIKIVQGQEKPLQRVFVNLIKNSVQAIDQQQNGRIEIRIEEQEQEQKQCYQISIIDNGPGVADHMQSRLFMPNFTSKTGGSGLGLAISRKIIEGMNGELIYQKTTHGACFVLSLPKNMS